MRRYRVSQMYTTVKDVYLNKKLDKKIYKGTYQAADGLNAIKIASSKTGIPQICLHADVAREG